MVLCRDKAYHHCFAALLVICSVSLGSAQNFFGIQSVSNEPPVDRRFPIVWCTINFEEQKKCEGFKSANERDQIRVGYDRFRLECYQASNKDECMTLLDETKVTLTSLDAGEVFIGGRYLSLVPISQEVLEGGFKFYYSVAVVKKGTLPDVHAIRDLKYRKACFAGVGTMAGWILPVRTLMKEGGMEIVDCNNHVKSAINYFGPSCAVNSLKDKYNPIGDNSDRLCSLCIGKVPGGRCTDADPYAGYDGAFRCLLEAGEVAFLKHNTVEESVNGPEFAGTLSKDTFELICKDGSRRPIDDFRACNWGSVPTNAIVTSSATSLENRLKLQKFLEKAAHLYSRNPQQNNTFYDNQNNRNNAFAQPQNPFYDNQQNRNVFGPQQQQQENVFGPQQQQQQNQENNRFGGRYKRQSFDPVFANQNSYSPQPFDTNRLNDSYPIQPQSGGAPYEVFNLFESSPKYGYRLNLLFQDAARSFYSLPEQQQTFSDFLGANYQQVMEIRECPVGRMTLCVTSDAEMDKCVKMRTALKAQLLQPTMNCYKGHSHIHCMQAIRAGTADVTVLDAGDVYTAGLSFDLVPFISEIYNLEKPEYYVVAVAKESDPSTELTYLRGKYTCHGGIFSAAGWVYPLALLISNGWMRPYGCDSIRAAAEYFTKSCVPGALSNEYNTGVPYDNMCHLCHGTSFRNCKRDASEDYYGHTGAFRCLVEGGGHVAFVKHTTVSENTGGKRREWWARDALIDDFELLCPDGTRAEVQDYPKCNLGKVKANAIVTRGGYAYNETQINAYINLFMYSQTFYGRKTADEFSFSMFSSAPPYADLIFSDATQQLKVIEPRERYYSTYLGGDFMRARRIVDCHAAGGKIQGSLLTILGVFIVGALLR